MSRRSAPRWRSGSGSTIHLLSRAPADTLAIGQVVGAALQSGDFVALSGPLGSGKTQLVKGIALGLGVPADEPVVSPSFVLVREYAGRLKLYHVDAYRLHAAADLLALGLDELCEERGAVVALEWADRAREIIPAGVINIELEYLSVDTADAAGAGRDRVSPDQQVQPDAGLWWETRRRLRLSIEDNRRRTKLARRLAHFRNTTHSAFPPAPPHAAKT